MKKFILIIVLLYSFPAHAIEFNTYQTKMLLIAKYYGEEIGWPETVQAILLHESLLNIKRSTFVVGDINNGFGRRSYGCMQIQLGTAQFVIGQYSLVTNYSTEEALIARLITDNEFNIYIGSLYFEYLFGRFGNWEASVVAYNRGPGWVESNREKVSGNKYLRAIRRLITHEVRPFNKKL